MAQKVKDPENRAGPDTTVRVPWDLLDQLQALAKAHERSLRAEVRVALAAYVQREQS